MGFLQSQVGLVVLWIVAGLTALWILGPLVLFLSPWRKLTTDVFDDPREAEAHGNDADFQRRIAELKALGFTPVGRTRERFPFFTPLHWIRVWNGCRYFASPDRRVFVEFHRLAAGHPQRMSANTTFEGGGLLVTSTAPSGMGGEIGERYRRVEVGSESVAELVREHERQVSDFSREAGLRVKAATLSDMATENNALSQPFVSRNRVAGLYAIASIYLMPLWAVFGSSHRLPRLAPLMLLGMAALYAVFRVIVLPEYRRIRWVGFAALMALTLGVPLLLPKLMPRARSGHPANHPGAVTPAAGADRL
jgi:hypothetical protein